MNIFSLEGKVAVIPGGGGVLGEAIAKGLSRFGAAVAVGDLFLEKAETVASSWSRNRRMRTGVFA